LYTLNVPVETPTRVAAWLDPEQVAFVRAVVDRVGLRIVAGGSSQVGRSGEVAAALGVQPLGDLRAALAAVDADVVLLAAPGDFAGGTGGSEAEDRGVLAACRQRGVRVFTLEPMPSSLLQLEVPVLAGGPDSPLPSAGDWATFAPSARLSRAVREAADVIVQLGALRTVAFAGWSGVGEGSLGARVFDGVDAVSWLLGEPESVSASFAFPGRGTPVHAVPGQSLRGLDGDLTANLRYADGRAGAVLASSRAGRWGRTLTLLGEGGRLRITDDGFEWIGPDGKTIDSARVPGVGLDDPAALAVEAVADQMSRALDPRVPAPAPTDYVQTLAIAGAVLLSARTGEAESPATLRRMAGVG
jgi:hypothetical protein